MWDERREKRATGKQAEGSKLIPGDEFAMFNFIEHLEAFKTKQCPMEARCI